MPVPSQDMRDRSVLLSRYNGASPAVMALLKRIEDRLDFSTDCWIWKGCQSHNGYGFVKAGGKQCKVHRVVYELLKEAIPDGMFLNHTCDNRLCCNPDHLYAGTQKENRSDCVRRRRTATGDRHGSRTHPDRVPRGERNGSSKLTDAQRAEMCSRFPDVGVNELGRIYGISSPSVLHSLRAAGLKSKSDRVGRPRSLTDEKLQAMREDYSSGMKTVDLADKYGVSVGTVHRFAGQARDSEFETLEERFARRTRRNGDCLEWCGILNSSGYGVIKIDGMQRLAHRVAYEMRYGPIPASSQINHQCDNRRCCNPDHLAAGTQLENMIEKTVRGRSACGDKNGSRLHPERVSRGDNHYARTQPERLARGERHGGSKLSDSQAEEVKRLYATGEWTQQEIADRFQIAQTVVGRIVRGMSRGQAIEGSPRRVVKYIKIGEKCSWAKVTDIERGQMIREYLAGGVTYKDLAERYGISAAAVCQAVKKYRTGLDADSGV